MMNKFHVFPVGYIRSGITSREEAPRQGRDSSVEARIEVLPQYVDAVDGITQWSRLLVTCWLHLADRDTLAVHPRGDTSAPLTGVFAARSPARPNPVAVYTVDLLSVEGNVLNVRGIDAVDGTPVLDIKPHIHRLDD